MNKTYKKILDLPYLPWFVKIGTIFGMNWTFQSILYMDKTERNFKIFLELVFFTGSLIIVNQFLSLPIAIIFSFVIGHTCNWLFNGHLFGLLKTFKFGKINHQTFDEYVKALAYRISQETSIEMALCYGSLVKGKFNEHSDLDIRIVRKTGFLNGFRSCIFVLFERSRALFNKFPLDIYVFDNRNSLSKMSADEDPVSLLN